MKNVSKNAVQAISLDGKMYLAHKSIENFSLGAGDFTIEVLFICNSITDCCFYAQEQGFEFGIKDGCLYFDLEGVGSIKQNEEISLETDALYFAAVSCKDGALSLYFEGFPVAEIAEVKPAGVENTGNFIIGKGLDGYIVEVRLRSCGMNDQEILHDCGMGLQDCDSIEFWSDFTTVQYKDKSSNALLLWTNEGIVLDVNASSCTQLSSKGGFATVTRQSYTSGYTLLFKIFPRLENNNTMYIYSVVSSEGKTVFSVGLQSDNEGYKHIFVEHNGASYLGESTLPLAQWIDVALRIESTEAKVYIDGTDELSFPFSGELTNITAMIGIKPFTKKVSFKNSFDGYLDYFAEFECALEADKIDFYAEEQPYIFDDSIRTLYAFYCGEPTDLASGGTMYKVGQSKALFVKNLNDLDAPIGMDFRVPQEVCAEWLELDEYEQWAMTTAMDIVREVYVESMGIIPAEGTLPIEQTATMRIMSLYEEEISMVGTLWTEENSSKKAMEFFVESMAIGVGGAAYSITNGLQNHMMSVLAKAAIGMVSKKVIFSVAAAVVVTGIIVIIVENISGAANGAIEDMPENKRGYVRLFSICCNHQGNPELGSIHFHSDENLTMPENMVYVNGNHLSIDLLLVTDRLAQGRVHVECVLENMTNETVSGDFTVKDYSVNEYNTFPSVIIPAKQKIAVTVILPVRPSGEEAEYREDTWEFFFGEKAMCTCQANIYFQRKMPIEPWTAHINEEYNKDIKTYPSLVFMKNMIFALKEETITNINDYMKKLYDSNILEYGSAADTYVDGYYRFKLIQFNRRLNECASHRLKVNCTVLANIVCLTEAQLGYKKRTTLIEPLNKEGCFEVNPVIGMGDTEWRTGWFSYHQIAFSSVENGYGFSKDARIYDLAVKIDSGTRPSEAAYDGKEGFLSGGYQACETDKPIIAIDEPYYGEYYLERLVKNGEEAYYAHLSMSVELDVETVQSSRQHNEIYTYLMERYMRNYELNDEKYTAEMPQSDVNSLLLQKMGLEKSLEDQYECEWSAPDGMRVTWFRNAEHLPAGEYLASVLMRFPCRLTEKEAPELGERAFYGPDLLITYFGGSAYLIKCKDMEKAEEMAHNLKSSMI